MKEFLSKTCRSVMHRMGYGVVRWSASSTDAESLGKIISRRLLSRTRLSLSLFARLYNDEPRTGGRPHSSDRVFGSMQNCWRRCRSWRGWKGGSMLTVAKTLMKCGDTEPANSSTFDGMPPYRVWTLITMDILLRVCWKPLQSRPPLSGHSLSLMKSSK